MIHITDIKLDFIDAMDKVKRGEKLDGTEHVIRTTGWEKPHEKYDFPDMKGVNTLRNKIRRLWLDSGHVVNVYFMMIEQP